MLIYTALTKMVETFCNKNMNLNKLNILEQDDELCEAVLLTSASSHDHSDDVTVQQA